MAAKTYIGGTGNLTIDGAAQPLGGSLSETKGGLVRAAKVGIGGKIGFVSKYAATTLDVEIFDDGTVNTDTITNMTNSTVLWEGDNGKTIVYTGCFQIDELGANHAEGTVKFKLGCVKRTEMLA